LIHELKGHTENAILVAFGPEGKRIVSASRASRVRTKPGELKVLDAETGRLLLEREGHIGGFAALTYHPDGKRIANHRGECG
jgi:WD40 repeat protein